MEVKRAGTFVEIAGQIVQMHPRAARDCLLCMAYAHAELNNRMACCNIAQCDLMAGGDVFGYRNLQWFGTKNFYHALGVLKQSGDVVSRIDLECAKHFFMEF